MARRRTRRNPSSLTLDTLVAVGALAGAAYVGYRILQAQAPAQVSGTLLTRTQRQVIGPTNRGYNSSAGVSATNNPYVQNS